MGSVLYLTATVAYTDSAEGKSGRDGEEDGKMAGGGKVYTRANTG